MTDCKVNAELARLREELEAQKAENQSLRCQWLQVVSHDVAFTAEVNEEHGVDLSKIPISEATLATVNISIDRENFRLREENERLREAVRENAKWG